MKKVKYPNIKNCVAMKATLTLKQRMKSQKLYSAKRRKANRVKLEAGYAKKMYSK